MHEKTRAGAGEHDVVVGVDGSDAGVDAVRYAVGEAHRTGGRVRIVHVLPEYVGTYYPVPVDELTASGRAVLRSTLDRVGPLDPAVAVSSVLRRGSPVAALVSDARAARALVVGSDRRPVARRLLTGDTTAGVCASSAAPVVCVPEGWTPAAHGSRGAVVVGVKNPAHAAEVLGEGFAAAHARRSRLVVLHAWSLPSGYDDVVVDRVAHEEWDDRARSELAGLAAPWTAAHPEVEVELRVVHGQAAHALVHASQEAEELVLVRRGHGLPAAVHLGATARAVLRHAACPVRVVSPGHLTPATDPVGAEVGAEVGVEVGVDLGAATT